MSACCSQFVNHWGFLNAKWITNQKKTSGRRVRLVFLMLILTKKQTINMLHIVRLKHCTRFHCQIPVGLNIISSFSNLDIIERVVLEDCIGKIPSTLVSIFNRGGIIHAWRWGCVAPSTTSWISGSLNQFMSNNTDSCINSSISIGGGFLGKAGACGRRNTNPGKLVGYSILSSVIVPSTKHWTESILCNIA